MANSRVASNELNKKRRIERALNNDLRKIFFTEKNRYVDAIKRELSTDDFKSEAELVAAVSKHFKRIRKRVLKSTDFSNEAFSAYQIIASENMYNDVVGSFNKLAISEQKKSEDVTEFNTKMTNAIPARTLLISNVATQPVYESAKLINSIDKNQDGVGSFMVGTAIAMGTLDTIYSSKKTKTWRSILSTNTRDPHAFADGQTVKVGEYFTVNGQQLMYPGDSKFATPDNFMNCHCSVQYN